MDRIKVGFIGLGQMGKPMATHLLQSGFDLTVYDIRTEPMDELAKLGAHRVRSVKEVAQTSPFVVTSLPHPKISEEVYLGETGLAAWASRGSVLIETSTIQPSLAGKMATAAKQKGLLLVDAAVSGGIAKAAEGALTMMIGGEKEAVAAAMPVLQALGKKLFHLGGNGQGMIYKIVNNAILSANFAAICEGFAMGVKAGADPKMLYEVIRQSSGNSDALNHYVPSILTRNYHAGGKLRGMCKDSTLAMELAQEIGIPLWVVGAAHAYHHWGLAAGLGEKYYSEMITLWEDMLGIKIIEQEGEGV